MKLSKIFALSAVFACGLTLASCGEKPTEQPTQQPTNEETSAKVSVGLGYAGSYAWKEATAYAPALGQLDLSAAMVAFDEQGKILDARIDVVQVKVVPAENGGLALQNGREDFTVATKLELGTKYGMQSSSNIGLEVDEQIENFADWTVGKTVEELKSLVAAEHGYGKAPHADLASSCTIVCHDFVAAIEKAFELKTEAKYEAASFKTGIAKVAGLAFNYGNPQTDISVDLGGSIVADGKVVAAQVDAVVYPLVVNEDKTVSAKTEGNQYVDANGKLVSKKSLGDAYAMKGVGTNHETGEVCTLEWYEQAAIIEAAAEGKTEAEISALVANQGDLAGATITLDSYVKAMATSAKYAEMELVSPRA